MATQQATQNLPNTRTSSYASRPEGKERNDNMSTDIAKAKFKKIILCDNCGKQLNETKEMTGKELWDNWTMLALTSGFNAGRCPNGCTPTYSDLNINTSTPVIDSTTGKRFELKAYKFLNGHFYSSDYDEVCACENRNDDEIYTSDRYPDVHGVCGRWLETYSDAKKKVTTATSPDLSQTEGSENANREEIG